MKIGPAAWSSYGSIELFVFQLKKGEKMIKKLPRYLLRRVLKLGDYLKWRYRKNSYESVYFFTFHKCASTLFSGYVLKNIEGLRHLDYATQIYNGQTIDNVTFEKTGFVYGPIRLTKEHPQTYKVLVEPASDIDFIRNKIALFMVRDPRDILVSAYYSFGWTHQSSPVKELREKQEQRKRKIQRKTVDEYALEFAHRWLNGFKAVDKLVKGCNRCVVLRYEDMIYSWECFAKDLTKYVDIKPTVLTQIYEKSRPRENEDKSSHRRSGMVGQFRAELKGETIKSLNTTFEAVLSQAQS